MGGYLNDELEELILEGMSEYECMELWNSYAAANERPLMYPMGDFEEALIDPRTGAGMSVLEVISRLDSDFNTEDSMFTVDDFGYICSFDDWYASRCPFDINELVESIVETGNPYGSDKVAELLEGGRV